MYREYTSDEHLKTSFRHEIGTLNDIYPDDWMIKDPLPMGDFLLPELKPGQIDQIRWKEDGSVVTENGYLIGLSPKIKDSLREYCDRMGITELF
jgi:hypothetical protein